VNPPTPSHQKDLFTFGGYRLDPARHTLEKDEKTLPLPPKAFELLMLLVQRRGELLTKADLLNALWPTTFVEENNLTQYISMLRKLLGEGVGEDQKYIETVPRLGYRFVANVQTLPSNGESVLWTREKKTKITIREEEEEEIDSGRDSVSEKAPARGQGRSQFQGQELLRATQTEIARASSASVWKLAMLGSLAAVLATTLYFAVRQRYAGRNRGPVPTMVAPIKPRHSVAVLGIKNLSGRKDEWLPGAFTEMLSTDLAAGGQLRVVPGEDTSRVNADLHLPEAAGFSESTLSEIRNRLGSDIVISGSMMELNRASGRQIRLDLRAQDAMTGEILASVAQTGTPDDLFTIVSHSGAQIREKLGVPGISGTEESELQAALPSTPEAVRLFSEGLLRLRSYDAAGAEKLLSRVAALEPSYALGHSALAQTWSALGYDERAKLAAKRAFDLSENLSRQDRLSIAAQYWETLRDWDKAVATYQELYALFPDNVEYGLRLADSETSAGKGKQALATIEGLRKLPPLVSRDPRIDLSAAVAFESLGDFEQEKLFSERSGQSAELVGARMVVARAALREGWALRRLGQGDESTAILKKAQELFSAAGDDQGVASALRASGAVFAEMGDYSRARKECEQALRIFRRIGDRRGTAVTLNSLAIIYYERGELDQAKRLYEQTLEIQRDVGSKTNTAGALGNIANVEDAQGHLAQALNLNQESLAIFRATGDQRATGTALGNVAILLYEMGDLHAAKSKYSESLEIKRQIGYQRGIAYDLSGLGEVFRAEGDLVTSRQKQEEALAIRTKIGEKHNAAASALYLAQLSLEESKPGEAEKQARDATGEFQAEKSGPDQAMAFVILSQSLLAQNKIPEAREVAEQARKLAKETTNLPLQFEILIASSRIAMAEGNAARKLPVPEFREKLEAALTQARKSGYLEYEFKLRLLQGELDLYLGNSSKGHTELATLQHDAAARGFGLIVRKANMALSNHALSTSTDQSGAN
jgi:DNA-binding winged helix-turn-helix (wHTH) protein/tetratricopeptide (TPR) repeat protein/TolB-like protein